MDKPIPEAVMEAVARAICVACEENPNHQGDARGNDFRWQDYRDAAVAAISAFSAAQADAALVAQTQLKRRRYDPNGSLSEYGIFPECDAQPLDTGITAAELGYALKRATPAQVIEYLEDDVNMRVALSIHFEEQHDQQPAAVDGLAARLVDELDDLVSESSGVSGLHLNGDVATWEELLPGGRFERLSSLDELREALATQRKGASHD